MNLRVGESRHNCTKFIDIFIVEEATKSWRLKELFFCRIGVCSLVGVLPC